MTTKGKKFFVRGMRRGTRSEESVVTLEGGYGEKSDGGEGGSARAETTQVGKKKEVQEARAGGERSPRGRAPMGLSSGKTRGGVMPGRALREPKSGKSFFTGILS